MFTHARAFAALFKLVLPYKKKKQKKNTKKPKIIKAEPFSVNRTSSWQWESADVEQIFIRSLSCKTPYPVTLLINFYASRMEISCSVHAYENYYIS